MGNGDGSIDEKLKQARRSSAAEPCDYDIRIASDGTWFYRGSPIARLALVKLFATVLSRDEEGAYWLTTPAERGRITVDDAPFTAVELTRASGPDVEAGNRILSFRSNLDHQVDAGPDNPIRVAFDAESGAPRPYILVRPGLEALILRPVYYELVDHACEVDGRTGVWSNGTFFPLDQES